MPSIKPRMTVRADKEIFDKINFIAEENERSFNQELVYLMKQRIKEYESKHGNIQIGDITITGGNNNIGNVQIGNHSSMTIHNSTTEQKSPEEDN